MAQVDTKVEEARRSLGQHEATLDRLERAQQAAAADVDCLRHSVVFAGDLVKLWKPLNHMTTDIERSHAAIAQGRAEVGELSQRVEAMAAHHAADTEALAASITELGTSVQDVHETACQEWYALRQ
jgi:methyl-accepting chemotaxis protein